jgi:lipopolysaccharide export LptBFGC system permease protein LptF
VLTWTTKKQTDDAPDAQRTTSRATAREATLALTNESPARLAVTLVDGATSDTGGGGYTEGRAKRQRIFIDLEDDRASSKRIDEMRSTELYYRLARLEPALGRQRQTKEWRTWRDFAREYWKRVALGLSPLAFALLGCRSASSRGADRGPLLLVIALVLALPVYYPLLLWGENLARLDILPASIAMNLPNFVLGGTGVFLIWRLVTR